DQKRRFLNHLHELRRINEGDDNADAPGYALNLVSIPISVLSGDCTQTGYGTECTITASPHLTDDLLPTTFRDLVINDLIELLGLQVTRTMEKIIDEKKADEAKRAWLQLDEAARDVAAGVDPQIARQKLTGLEQKVIADLVSTVQPPGLSQRPGKRRPISPSEVNEVIGGVRIIAVALAL